MISQSFGVAVVSNAAVTDINMRFPGQYWDKETGTHYNFHRDYDPHIGRYLQSDPIGLDGGINNFAYVAANPLTRIDPLGLVNHNSGPWKQCGNCRYRIDFILEESTGKIRRHVHWECKNSEGVRGEFGEDSHNRCDALPKNVRKCLEAAGFGCDPLPVPEPDPKPLCDGDCQKKIVKQPGTIGAIILFLILICLTPGVG